jgi:hypothetical protein
MISNGAGIVLEERLDAGLVAAATARRLGVPAYEKGPRERPFS